MDRYAGNPADPKSLHKHLYAHADPVNNADPTGYFTMSEVRAGQQVQAILTLSAAAAGANLVPSFKEKLQLEVAKNHVFARAGQNTRQGVRGMPVIFYGFDVYQVTDHIDYAQSVKGILPVLSRTPLPHRRDWTQDTDECRGKTFLGSGLECDEYPFASTVEGGKTGYPTRVSLRPLNQVQNGRAGWQLGSFYRACGVNPFHPIKKWFGVVPAADGQQSSYSCADGNMQWFRGR